jgi:mannonate dehydratase
MPLEDYHVHVIGRGFGGTGCEINPDMLSLGHPFKRAMAMLYLRASGVGDIERLDEQYLERLTALTRGFGHPVRLHLLAMDRFYTPDGISHPERMDFYVPNDYVLDLARRHPDLFVPVVSVHPYRPDAVAELERCAAAGARFVKWLPNAQGIDPMDPRLDPFYARMRELGMVLLSHTGTERAVTVKDAQALGNPLRLRRALDDGVTVIMAHCGSLGQNEDLDHPGRTASNFELFLRVVEDPRYRGRAFGDLSAITLVNRAPEPLRTLMRRPELWDKLVNGTDYPLPGFYGAVSPLQMTFRHWITRRELRALNEIARINPLLFDFVLKRTLRDPATGRGLPVSVFLANPAMPSATRPLNPAG